jgi:hypothetical protein
MPIWPPKKKGRETATLTGNRHWWTIRSRLFLPHEVKPGKRRRTQQQSACTHNQCTRSPARGPHGLKIKRPAGLLITCVTQCPVPSAPPTTATTPRENGAALVTPKPSSSIQCCAAALPFFPLWDWRRAVAVLCTARTIKVSGTDQSVHGPADLISVNEY